jgi:hypothetical protein
VAWVNGASMCYCLVLIDLSSEQTVANLGGRRHPHSRAVLDYLTPWMHTMQKDHALCATPLLGLFLTSRGTADEHRSGPPSSRHVSGSSVRDLRFVLSIPLRK